MKAVASTAADLVGLHDVCLYREPKSLTKNFGDHKRYAVLPGRLNRQNRDNRRFLPSKSLPDLGNVSAGNEVARKPKRCLVVTSLGSDIVMMSLSNFSAHANHDVREVLRPPVAGKHRRSTRLFDCFTVQACLTEKVLQVGHTVLGELGESMLAQEAADGADDGLQVGLQAASHRGPAFLQVRQQFFRQDRQFLPVGLRRVAIETADVVRQVDALGLRHRHDAHARLPLARQARGEVFHHGAYLAAVGLPQVAVHAFVQRGTQHVV